MKVLVCEAPGSFRYAEGQMPVAKEGQALIRIHRIGVCGTDLHAFEGVQPYFKYPRVLGHELAAEFVEGDGNTFAPGDHVTVLPYLNCNSCIACRNGKPNCCVNMNVCGVHSDGGMVEYLAIPYDAVVSGQGLALNELALVEPIAIGTHALTRAQLLPGEFVLVIGAGPIGLGIIEVAALRGARVIAMDVNDARLAFCRENFNVTTVINPLKVDAAAELKRITGGDMPTLVIDATGNRKAIYDGFNWISHGGRYVLVGLQKDDITFSHPEFHKREATLMSSRNATKADFNYVIENIRAKRINVQKFITHSITFDKAAQEFPTLLDPARGVVKAVITMTQQ